MVIFGQLIIIHLLRNSLLLLYLKIYHYHIKCLPLEPVLINFNLVHTFSYFCKMHINLTPHFKL